MKAILSVILSLILTAGALQARETDWVSPGAEVRTRLIGTSTVGGSKDKVWLAWEAEMQDGWKTYWRSPGDAGLPVVVTIQGQKVDLAYPLPSRFSIFDIDTIGYAKKVVIPFQVDKSLLEKGGDINVSYMVCKDICIPYSSSYPVPVMRMIDYDMLISQWLDKVPEKRELREFQVLRHQVTGPKGHQRIILDVKGITELSKAVVFCEGPEGVSFTPAERTEKGYFTRFVLKPTGATVPDLRGLPLRVTIGDGDKKAIDVTVK